MTDDGTAVSLSSVRKTLIQWNPVSSNFLGKRNLVRDIGKFEKKSSVKLRRGRRTFVHYNNVRQYFSCIEQDNPLCRWEWKKKNPHLHVKKVNASVRQIYIPTINIISTLQTTRMKFEKLLGKRQLQSVLMFFKFIHPCLLYIVIVVIFILSCNALRGYFYTLNNFLAALTVRILINFLTQFLLSQGNATVNVLELSFL